MTNNINQIAGRAVAGAFLSDPSPASGQTIEGLYKDFLTTLSSPEAKQAFDLHIF